VHATVSVWGRAPEREALSGRDATRSPNDEVMNDPEA
jgi:hypothetical protein